MEIVAGINPRMQFVMLEIMLVGSSLWVLILYIFLKWFMTHLSCLSCFSSNVFVTCAYRSCSSFVRSPMVSALSAWDLAQLSEGRFDLGLGTRSENIENGMECPLINL